MKRFTRLHIFREVLMYILYHKGLTMIKDLQNSQLTDLLEATSCSCSLFPFSLAAVGGASACKLANERRLLENGVYISNCHCFQHFLWHFIKQHFIFSRIYYYVLYLNYGKVNQRSTPLQTCRCCRLTMNSPEHYKPLFAFNI